MHCHSRGGGPNKIKIFVQSSAEIWAIDVNTDFRFPLGDWPFFFGKFKSFMCFFVVLFVFYIFYYFLRQIRWLLFSLFSFICFMVSIFDVILFFAFSQSSVYKQSQVYNSMHIRVDQTSGCTDTLGRIWSASKDTLFCIDSKRKKNQLLMHCFKSTRIQYLSWGGVFHRWEGRYSSHKLDTKVYCESKCFCWGVGGIYGRPPQYFRPVERKHGEFPC